MRRTLALTCVLTAAVAACGSSHASAPTRVEALHVTRDVGCSGWYELTGHTLEAHLTYVGEVRAVVVSATFDDGSSLDPQPATPVAAGVRSQTVRVRGIERGVAAAQASVMDPSGRPSACALGNPH